MIDLYTQALRELRRAGADFLVIGVSGINYYARDASSLIMTADFDLFLKPDEENLRRALAALSALGFDLVLDQRRLRRITPRILAGILSSRRTVAAASSGGHLIELCLQVSGFTYEEMARNAVTFRTHRVPVRVGDLGDLLRSKEIADGPKDRNFLARYREILGQRPTKRRRG